MFQPISFGLGVFSLVAIWFFYLAGSDVSQRLSPQGCRMAYMLPSYILQSRFDSSWSPLARRYSLWLYREIGWESNQLHGDDSSGGVPVLFIPGNAGSSRQVRSIASSAIQQFYSSPYIPAPAFAAGELKPLDFFAVEFNEDLSAFHGPTLDSQIAYSSHAISYILSLYPSNTSIILMGHSMGGIVATSLLSSQSQNISAVITMSTPHTLPPARFDSRVDVIYAANQRILDTVDTPIVSLCGGATDTMIPSESCVLPAPADGAKAREGIYRRTVFTSALEGAWTGVGHREMVWCHQVRWRVARAALEVGASASPRGKGVILDKWLRDGHALPDGLPESNDNQFSPTNSTAYELLPVDNKLILKNPQSSRIYFLPLPSVSPTSTLKFITLVSQGSISPISPQNALPLLVSVHLCTSPSTSISHDLPPQCGYLRPTTLKLIPNPVPGTTFPVENEGSDESDGVVLYEANVPLMPINARWVSVRIDHADGRGWVVGGFVTGNEVTNNVGTLGLVLFRGVSIAIPDQTSLLTRVTLPNLVSNALIVYRIIPKRSHTVSGCADTLLAPLVMHNSHSSETHYFPLTHSPPHHILLHTHSSAPYIRGSPSLRHGVNFTIYYSGSTGCRSGISGVDVHVDWSATLGRWAFRYPTTLASWGIGIVALVLLEAWGPSDRVDASMSSVPQSLSQFEHRTLVRLIFGSFLVSLIPFSENYFLGNIGEPIFAPMGPLLLLLVCGLVRISWWVLVVLMWPLGQLKRLRCGRRKEKFGSSRLKRTIISTCLVFLLIFLFVPWQVAFLGCWLVHLYTCASSTRRETLSASATIIPVVPPTIQQRTDRDSVERQRHMMNTDTRWLNQQYYNVNDHLLLLMTWLLPLVAPSLAVWVRTLATAGLTTPFDDDHFFLNVAPFLLLVAFASWTPESLLIRSRFEKWLSVRWTLAVVGGIACLTGPRRTYVDFDAANIAIGLMVLMRVGPRCWSGTSWSAQGDKRGQ